MRPERLFQPIVIGGMRVRNRIVMPAMATNFASSTGEPTHRMIAYYARRARGGVGLIVVENATVEHPRGANGATQLRADEDRYIPGLYQLARAIAEAGAKASIQINHAGALARSDRTGVPAVAPSTVAWTDEDAVPLALTSDEIERLIDRYASAAVRAQRAGFDAVEIHGAHGYLIAQFLSPRVNRRTDAYGGSPERRWRFALEVVRAVRRAVGAAYPILFRVSGDELLPDGRGIDETVALTRALVDAGVDAIDVSCGTAANPEKQLEPMSYPEAWRVHLATAVKRAVDVPVIAVGVIRTPETAERILAEGSADAVAIGRGLIADPDWPRKAARGQGSSIRRCISCNRCVRHRVFDDLPIRCSVNPRVGREAEPVEPAAPMRVVVVGGGPGGLEAAATAASAGHRVTLFEADPALGGRLRLAAVPPHKEKIGWLIEDLIRALPESVDIRLGIRATRADLLALRPDAVILATGGTPKRLGLPGAGLPHVVSADAVLSGAVDLSGERVVLIGGGMVGCETAAFCAERGCRVVVLEQLEGLALDAEPITRSDLLARLASAGVELRAATEPLEIAPGSVRAKHAEGTKEWPADHVVVAVGMQPNCELEHALEQDTIPLCPVGDTRAARGICEAIGEGWRAGAIWLADVARWNGGRRCSES